MIMNEELITFETAKLAKEKEFDWTSKCYHSDGSFQDREYLQNYNHSVFIDKDEYLISAPTQSLLQKWLREVHNIHVFPVIEPLGRKYRGSTVYNEKKDNYIESNFYYNSYEEALEIGLQEALKLISNE